MTTREWTAEACTTLEQAIAATEEALELLSHVAVPKLVEKSMGQCARQALTKLEKARAWHCGEEPLSEEEIRARENEDPEGETW